MDHEPRARRRVLLVCVIVGVSALFGVGLIAFAFVLIGVPILMMSDDEIARVDLPGGFVLHGHRPALNYWINEAYSSGTFLPRGKDDDDTQSVGALSYENGLLGVIVRSGATGVHTYYVVDTASRALTDVGSEAQFREWCRAKGLGPGIEKFVDVREMSDGKAWP